MTECSDTESCELIERPSRRLRLTWNASAPDVVPPTDSHDQRLARVRRVMQRERRDRAVQAASEFLSSVVERVGPVDVVGEVPREVRRLHWSVFNVPLMWAAAAGDDDWAVLGWLSARAVNLPPVFVDSVQVPALEALHIGWRVLCDTMRSWGVSSREDLAEWMHRQGFVRPRWGAHFSGRIQERILNAVEACSSEHAAAPPEVRPRATADRAPPVGETQWNCLDDIQL